MVAVSSYVDKLNNTEVGTLTQIFDDASWLPNNPLDVPSNGYLQ